VGYLRPLYTALRRPFLTSGVAVLTVLWATLGSGCTSPAGEARSAAPTSDVRRVEAWQDAERIAAAAPDRSPAVGRGESMAPIFGDSTMLVLTRLPFSELEPGMMVAYRNLNGFQVVHRLVERTARGEWTVRGLNNPRMDQERVTAANYLGVVYASLAHEERNPAGAPASSPAPPRAQP
jgi:hypothetical protein